MGAARLRVEQDYPKEGGNLMLLPSLDVAIMEAQWRGMENYLKGIELLQKEGSSPYCQKKHFRHCSKQSRKIVLSP